MIDRSVTANPNRYRMTPVGGGTALDYDVSFLGTVAAEGTVLTKQVLLPDTLATTMGLDIAETDPAQSDFASPANALQKIWTRIDGLLNIIYPIGTIYMTDTISSAGAMATQFGGTWAAWGAGKVPVGYSSGDADFGTIGGTGGSKTSFQAHTHSTPAHTHTIDNATSTMASSGGGTSGSTTPAATGANSVSHTHTWSNTHDHSFEYISDSVATGGAYSANLTYTTFYFPSTTGSSSTSFIFDETISGTTGNNSVSHTHTSAAHTHTTPDHAHTMNAHTHTVTSSGSSTSGSAGTSGSTNLQPYQVCYFWKRTA